MPRSALLPSRTTARVKRVGPAPMTRSVALPVRPPDVAVIVVVPGLRAVATPVAGSIVATPVSLLVHVTPSPTTVTGVIAFPSGRLRSCPSPSRPKRPRPQHCTRPPRRSAQVCSAPEVAATAPVTGSTVADGNGAYSINGLDVSGLDDGTIDFTVTQSDAAGNPDTTPTQIHVSKDTITLALALAPVDDPPCGVEVRALKMPELGNPQACLDGGKVHGQTSILNKDGHFRRIGCS